MASGFQNSQDQLTPNYYRVVITTSGYSTTASSTASGGVEAWDYNYFSTLNTTLNNSLRRARGNIRFNAILSELQKYANCEILDITVKKTGPADETAADHTSVSVSFTVGYAQEEYFYAGLLNETDGANLSDGATPLDGATWEALSTANQASNIATCVKEAVTRGITIGGSAGYSRRYRTYDPSLPGQVDSVVTVTQPDTPANIWATVSVSQIDTMTQQTSN
jgi:hypothetical protein